MTATSSAGYDASLGLGWRKLTDTTGKYTGCATGTLTVFAAAVDSYAVFKCVAKDTDSASNTYNKTFTDVATFIDNSDPIQVIITSTGGSMTLTAIDRTAPTVTFSTSSVTANGFKISASSSATADIWQYSTNNGSSWTQFSTTADTSASVTLPSLSPNTSYTVKLRARKKSNQVYGTSSSATVKTLDGAEVNSVSTVTSDTVFDRLQFLI